jgi:hypothetical protein
MFTNARFAGETELGVRTVAAIIMTVAGKRVSLGSMRNVMTKNEFHNALRILTSIDAHELEAAGVIRHADHNAWGTFRRDPYRWFIRADDATAEKLWKIIERRMK